MTETYNQHPLEYRAEIVMPLFDIIKAGDSCAVVGAASMGKSRLLRFLARPEVQEYYLKAQAAKMLMLGVDGNRLTQRSDWGLYEAMLTSIVDASKQHPELSGRHVQFSDLRSPVILKKEPLLAYRTLELIVRLLAQELGFNLCFLLDEFDELYRNLPATALANLRSLRDDNKYHLCYLLFLRSAPEALRPQVDCEEFYELFSRFVLGLKPYLPKDARGVLAQLEERRQHKLPETVKEKIIQLSGGHPGLMLALFDVSIENPLWILNKAGDTLIVLPDVAEECRKLRDSLPEDERQDLVRLLRGEEASEHNRRWLLLKGLVKMDPAQKSTPGIPLFALSLFRGGV